MALCDGTDGERCSHCSRSFEPGHVVIMRVTSYDHLHDTKRGKKSSCGIFSSSLAVTLQRGLGCRKTVFCSLSNPES